MPTASGRRQPPPHPATTRYDLVHQALFEDLIEDDLARRLAERGRRRAGGALGNEPNAISL